MKLIEVIFTWYERGALTPSDLRVKLEAVPRVGDTVSINGDYRSVKDVQWTIGEKRLGVVLVTLS